MIYSCNIKIFELFFSKSNFFVEKNKETVRKLAIEISRTRIALVDLKKVTGSVGEKAIPLHFTKPHTTTTLSTLESIQFVAIT